MIGVIILFVLPVVSLHGQHGDPAGIVPEAREQWLANARKEMSGFRPDTCTNIIDPDITDLGEEYYACSYRLKDPGMIRISGKEWIYMIPSSSHDNPEVGDITLAMDRKERFYINEGHICGGIIHFQSLRKIDLKTSRQFFKYFTSDTDSLPWKKIKN
jgi:hypothetical protein